MTKRPTIEEIMDKIKEIHGYTIVIDPNTYIAMAKKARFIDIEYGEWWAKPTRVIHRKQGHKRRGPEKAKRTFMKNYGVDSPLKSDKIKEKVKNTCLERYGTENPAQNESVKNKMHQTCIDRFGVPHALQNEDIRNKVTKTNIEKYGAPNPLQNEDVKKKKRKTNMKKYGAPTPAQNPEILKKMKQTSTERYGTDNPSKSPEIIEKIRQTNIEKYGVEWTGQVPEFIEKKEKTNMERYGVKSTLELPETKEKIKQTCIEKYGVDHPMKNHEIALKAAKATNNSITLHHWKTGKELTCTASYEIKAVKYFNAHKINYEWQPQTFTMPDGRTFRPDCYLPDEETWVEIKGYFRKDAKEKWDWFHNTHPDSELWNEVKLKLLGIL